MANFSPYKKRTEPSMRDELIKTFNGGFPEIKKSYKAVLRKMRRDTNGNLTQCPCVSRVTQEPDIDAHCPYCQNEGYYWDETWIDVYKVIIKSDVGNSLKEFTAKQGNINPPLATFYIIYDEPITQVDRIVEISLTSEGIPVVPYYRESLYRIGTLIDFRLDNGRIEYWKATCYLEERKYLNGV